MTEQNANEASQQASEAQAPTAGVSATGNQVLEATTWVLEAFGPLQELQPALPDARVDLVFDQDASRVVGKAGCNRYFGGYTLDGTKLTIGQAGATRMACGEAVMRQEAAYLAALGTVSSYRVDGDALELTYDGGVLRFRAA